MTTDKIILPDSKEAATYRTDIRGWVARDGKFYGDGKTAEEIARWAGCTHVRCGQCGTPTPKGYTRCDACRRQAEIERYEAMPRAEWDGKAMLYSDANEQFYDGPEDAENELEDGQTLADLRLIICKPVYVRPLERDYFEDDMSDESELPAEVEEAMDAFNEAVAGIILSWEPGKTALKLEP